MGKLSTCRSNGQVLTTMLIAFSCYVVSGCTMHYQYCPPERLSASPLISEKIGVLTLEDKTDRNSYCGADRIVDPVGSLSEGFARALVDAGVFADTVYIGGDSRQADYAGDSLRRAYDIRYVLYGEVTNVYGKDYPRAWGFVPPAILLGIPALLGIPSFPGKMEMDLAFNAKIMDLRDKNVVWAKSFRIHTERTLWGTFYYAQSYKDENVRAGFNAAVNDLVKSVAKAKDAFSTGTIANRSDGDKQEVMLRKARTRLDEKSLALLIGVEDYLFLGNVPGCTSDAKTMAKTVRTARRMSSSSVIVMTDDAKDAVNKPNKATMKKRLEGLAQDVDEGGLAFVYFSGHGVMQNKQLHLVPQNCDEKDGIPLAYVIEQLAKSKAGQKVVVLDVCRPSEDHGVDKIVPSLVKARKDVAVFMSCDEGEKSYPAKDRTESVYSGFFVRALTELSADTSEPVTARGLHKKVAEEMKEWRKKSGKRQTPQLIMQGGSDIILIPARKE